jgi:hypothetical protein
LKKIIIQKKNGEIHCGITMLYPQQNGILLNDKNTTGYEYKPTKLLELWEQKLLTNNY